MEMFTGTTRETIESVLDRRLQCPVFEKTTGTVPLSSALPEKSVEKRIDVNKLIISLLRDIAFLTKSGAIRSYSDEYYSNYSAFREAEDIEDKYFGENGLDWRKFIDRT